MTEEEALATSTGWAKGEYIGYLGFRAVNVLLATKKYQLHQSCAWGYTLKKLNTL